MNSDLVLLIVYLIAFPAGFVAGAWWASRRPDDDA